jgi:hypothetical protein
MFPLLQNLSSLYEIFYLQSAQHGVEKKIHYFFHSMLNKIRVKWIMGLYPIHIAPTY